MKIYNDFNTLTLKSRKCFPLIILLINNINNWFVIFNKVETIIHNWTPQLYLLSLKSNTITQFHIMNIILNNESLTVQLKWYQQLSSKAWQMWKQGLQRCERKNPKDCRHFVAFYSWYIYAIKKLVCLTVVDNDHDAIGI